MKSRFHRTYKVSLGYWLVFFSMILGWTQAHAEPQWLDRSHRIFLPTAVNSKLDATVKFPIFWWNFLVLQLDDKGWEKAEQVCRVLTEQSQSLITKVACGSHPGSFKELLRAWADDYPLRHPRPSDKVLNEKLDQTLAQAALPMDGSLLDILRSDPLQSYVELQNILKARVQLDLPQVNGMFYDSESQRLVIPIQFSFPPDQTLKTKQFINLLGGPETTLHNGLYLIGAHASTLENESQIMGDVKIVSRVGLLLVILQIAAMLWLRRWRLILMIPPVFLATLLSGLVTVYLFGSIHGLTLSFGTGIIGLAMDYGLHSCFNQRWGGTWRANIFGLFTTIVALLAMLFSSIPLLRQMMTFSVLGLVFAFAIFYILHKSFPKFFSVDPLPIRPKVSPVRFGLIVIILMAFVAGVLFLRPNFDMRQLNFQSPQNKEVSLWLFHHFTEQSPLIAVNDSPAEPLEASQRDAEWAQKNHLSLDNISDYLPPLDEQEKNLASWRASACKHNDTLSGTRTKFFSHFFQNISCDHLHSKSLSEKEAVPTYLSDFHSHGTWISMWHPKSPEEIAKIKAHVESALSLTEILAVFPQTLGHELLWMVPLAMCAAAILLWICYSSWYLALLSLLPFFTGLGVFALLAMVFRFQISFISLIALVMIFGLSLDYGIFTTNLFTEKDGPTVAGVWSALVFAASATVLGFVPLLFCQHPVLTQLGQALVWGTVGTILGCLWGIPGVHKLAKRVGK